MKKFLIWTIALTLALTAAAFAEQAGANSALDAFNKLTQQSTTPASAAHSDKSGTEYLTEVMSGMYLTNVSTQEAAAAIAPALQGLSSVTSVDIALYAGENNISMEKVRNTYFQSLANVLRAEIMVNPASEAKYRDIQVILSLFLYKNTTDTTSAIARDAIRDNMTKEHAQTIAAEYDLPLSFVEFMIMDDDWDDSDYMNDAAWAANANYAWSYGDTPDLTPDNTPDKTPDDTPVKATAKPAATSKPKTSYTNTPDNTPDKTPDNTPDKTPDKTPDDTPVKVTSKPKATAKPKTSYTNTPDNTPDKTPDNTPDKNTPDNTPDKNTPDNTPDKNTPDNTPDKNTPDNTPDNTRD